MISVLRALLITLLASAASVSWAQGQYVDLYPKSVEDLQVILDTLEDSIPATQTTEDSPIVVMLHGEEAHRFVRGNYQANKAIVDQMAKLAAYDVIDVKICETWMRNNNYEQSDLFPFIGTVPYGVAELKRLEKEEGFAEYGSSL